VSLFWGEGGMLMGILMSRGEKWLWRDGRMSENMWRRARWSWFEDTPILERIIAGDLERRRSCISSPLHGLSTERNPRSSKLSESGYSTLGCRIQVGQGNLERLTTRQNLRAGKRLRLYGVPCSDVSDLTQQQNLCLPPHFLDIKQHTPDHADTCRYPNNNRSHGSII
jgi:hypothetical protein